MSFVDEASVHIRAGDGGKGCVSFRRERFVEFGGPNGGNGGSGGSVIFVGSAAVNTLLYFKYHRHIKAENGKDGLSKNRSGASGKDSYIEVPLGTEIYDTYSGELLVDIYEDGQKYIAVRGGKGGIGNTQYKSSTNRAPVNFTFGEEGEECFISLKLKVLSDIGLIGMPNAGKSCFLSRCSMSKTKVADYPFTTLEPHLGVVHLNHRNIVIADIPGIIEDASLGAGLGHKFLKHIERCKVLLHIIDSSQSDVVHVYNLVAQELEKYSEEYGTSTAAKKEVIVLNKCDLISADEASEKQQLLKEHTKKTVVTLSLDESPVTLLQTIYPSIMDDFCAANTRDNKEKKFDPFLYIGYK